MHATLCASGPTGSLCPTTAAAGSTALSRLARALPHVVDAVGDDLTVLADGGIRSGLDIVRMLALGARGVLLGRAYTPCVTGGMGARRFTSARVFSGESLPPT